MTPTDPLAAVRALVATGVPVLVLPPRRGGQKPEFDFPTAWQSAPACEAVLDSWREGYGLAAVTGVAFDVIDIDPRNRGDETFELLRTKLPPIAGIVDTPGGGRHLYVPPSGLPSKSFGGIDYLAANHLVYLPGTRRPKYGGRDYAWNRALDFDVLALANDGTFFRGLAHLKGRSKAPAHRTEQPTVSRDRGWTRYGRAALLRLADDVAQATENRNQALNMAAYRCGQLVTAGELSISKAELLLMDAARDNGLAAEDGEAACLATIRSGLTAAQRGEGDRG